MDAKWLVALAGLLLIGSLGVGGDHSQKEAIAIYEKAIMEQMGKLKKLGKADQNQDAMKDAMASVEHLKPANLPVEDLIGLMGRVFQSQMGLNINIKKPEDFEREAAEKEAAEAKMESKKNKSNKKKKKNKDKRPSMSRSDEL